MLLQFMLLLFVAVVDVVAALGGVVVLSVVAYSVVAGVVITPSA